MINLVRIIYKGFFKEEKYLHLNQNLNCEVKGFVFKNIFLTLKANMAVLRNQKGDFFCLQFMWNLVTFPKGEGFGFEG